MNKQELIDYCNAIKENKSQIINCIDVNRIIKKIEQLDESQKVTVPQFVADLIEEARVYEWDLDDLFEHISEYSGDSEVSTWFYTLGNVDVLARAWLDGYTVEKEKKYIVKINNVFENASYLNHSFMNKRWIFADILETDGCKTKHTSKELEEAGFGWVLDCPGIEVKEVE